MYACYLAMDRKCPTIAKHSRNLNICYLENKLDPCHHREGIIDTMQKMLLRKNKANILLTGVAGCGKTAIAEGLAAVITQRKLGYMEDFLLANKVYKKEYKKWTDAGQVGEKPAQPILNKSLLSESVVYDLSLNSLVGGTKYRGEFEERLTQVIKECRENPDIILFVDEIHHMGRVGAAEGCVSAAQILKPALARNEVRVIGATTTDESEELLKDAAIARRFTHIEVPVLKGDAALDTARNILRHYSEYHKVTTNVSADELLTQVRFHLPDTVFPDNFINVVDETLAGAVFEGETNVGHERFYQTLSRLAGRLIICTAQAG